MKHIGYMAIDQYGTTYHIDLAKCGDHPRKWLLDHLGRKHAKKMWVDTRLGKPHHVGWIIRGLWLRVWRVCPLVEV